MRFTVCGSNSIKGAFIIDRTSLSVSFLSGLEDRGMSGDIDGVTGGRDILNLCRSLVTGRNSSSTWTRGPFDILCPVAKRPCLLNNSDASREPAEWDDELDDSYPDDVSELDLLCVEALFICLDLLFLFLRFAKRSLFTRRQVAKWEYDMLRFDLDSLSFVALTRDRSCLALPNL